MIKVTGLHREGALEIKQGMTYHAMFWFTETGRGDYLISNYVLLGSDLPSTSNPHRRGSALPAWRGAFLSWSAFFIPDGINRSRQTVLRPRNTSPTCWTRGAKLACGSRRHPLGSLFYEPMVLTDLPPHAAIKAEELFGPVAPITAFDMEEEVVARANATECGLVAYLHNLDPRQMYRVSRALNFGIVAVKRTKVPGAPIPFGGTKQAGLDREGARVDMQE